MGVSDGAMFASDQSIDRIGRSSNGAIPMKVD
jgi:hypothetical protein